MDSSAEEVNALFYGAAFALSHRVQLDDQKLASHKSSVCTRNGFRPAYLFPFETHPPNPD